MASTKSSEEPKRLELTLVLNTAGHFIQQHAAIAAVYRTESTTMGMLKDKHDVKGHQICHFKEKSLNQERISSEEGAQLYALTFGLGIAKQMIRKDRTRDRDSFSEVVVSTASQSAVNIINHHVRNARGRKSLEEIGNEDTRSMVVKVFNGIKSVEKFGVKVDLAVSDLLNHNGQQAVVMASQRVRRAAAGHPQQLRHQQRQQSEIASGDEGEVVRGFLSGMGHLGAMIAASVDDGEAGAGVGVEHAEEENSETQNERDAVKKFFRQERESEGILGSGGDVGAEAEGVGVEHATTELVLRPRTPREG